MLLGRSGARLASRLLVRRRRGLRRYFGGRCAGLRCGIGKILLGWNGNRLEEWFDGAGIDTHGKRKMNAKPTASLRLTDMNRPFKRMTARMKRRSSVMMSTAAMNCHRLYYIVE